MNCKKCGQMLIPGKDYCVGCGETDEVTALSLQIETLKRDRAHRIARNIKRTKINLILYAVVGLSLLTPYIYGFYLWLHRTGWEDDFFLYMSQQGISAGTLIDLTIKSIYFFAVALIVQYVVISKALKNLRVARAECEQLGLDKNGLLPDEVETKKARKAHASKKHNKKK